jgi:hypothetical protein
MGARTEEYWETIYKADCRRRKACSTLGSASGRGRGTNLGVEGSRGSSEKGVLVVEVDGRRHLGQELDRFRSSSLERLGDQGRVDTWSMTVTSKNQLKVIAKEDQTERGPSKVQSCSPFDV